MKKTLIGAALVATFALAGCSAQTPAVITPEVEAPVDAPAGTGDVTVDTGLAVLRDMYPEANALSDDAILDIAVKTCDLFDAGGTFADYVVVAMSEDVDTEFAGGLAGFAVNVVCPEHADIAEGY